MLHLFRTSDEQLMWRVKLADDAHAFGVLMARWQKQIQSLCCRMIGDTHRAEDLCQAAFSRVFSHRARWEPKAKFSTFLWRIALNLCHDELRVLKRRGECSLENLQLDPESAQDEMPAAEPAPDESAMKREQAVLVRQALLALADHYREVIVLRHYEHLKFHEIAGVLGIPEGTVKSRMAEALTQLTRLLQHLNEDLCTPKNHNPAKRPPQSIQMRRTAELLTV